MKIVLSVVFLLFASNCSKVKVEQTYDPTLGIESAWQSGSPLSGEPLDSWWKSFKDDELSHIVEQTLNQNRDVYSAAARVEAALVEARIAGNKLSPTVTANVGVNRRKQNFIGFPIPGAENRVLNRTFSTFGASLDVSWEADFWGRLSSEELTTYHYYEVKLAELSALQLSLAAQVSKAWFACMETLGQVSLAQETVESYRESSNAIRSRIKSGELQSYDLRLILGEIASTESHVQQWKEQQTRTIRQLEILSGLYPSGTLSLGNSLPELPGPVPAGIPSEMIGRRPDLIAGRKRLLAADAMIAASKAALYPRFRLTNSLGTSSDALQKLLGGDFSVWSLAANAVQPIFNSGRLKKEVGLARIKAKEAMHNHASSVLRALSEVEAALSAESILNKRFKALRKAEKESRNALSLSQLRYKTGVGNSLLLLESKRRLLNIHSQILTLQRLRLDNRVDLHLALGGGLNDFRADSQLENVPKKEKLSLGREK